VEGGSKDHPPHRSGLEEGVLGGTGQVGEEGEMIIQSKINDTKDIMKRKVGRRRLRADAYCYGMGACMHC
jgi:hypothetical protein